MASTRRTGRASSPGAGAAANSRSSSASVSAATASSRARKGLVLPFIFGIAPLSLAEALIIPSVLPWFPSEFLYQVLSFKARRAKRVICGARYYGGDRAGDLVLFDRGARGLLASGRAR